jgi:hypothetical protein
LPTNVAKARPNVSLRRKRTLQDPLVGCEGPKADLTILPVGPLFPRADNAAIRGCYSLINQHNFAWLAGLKEKF